LLVLNAVLWFIDHFERLNAFHIIYSTCIALAGILFMSDLSGIGKIIINAGDKSLKIKWFNKIRYIQISFNEIEGIYLKKSEVAIARNEKRPMKFRLDNLEVSQRKEVYDYFISFSKEKGLDLVKQFNS
jgi:hypothetical protein